MLEVLLKEYDRMEGWLLQHKGGERMRIQDIDQGFQEASTKVQERGLVLIPK